MTKKIVVTNSDWQTKKLVITNKTIISRYPGRNIPTFEAMCRKAAKI